MPRDAASRQEQKANIAHDELMLARITAGWHSVVEALLDEPPL
jgi:hypothetical protein